MTSKTKRRAVITLALTTITNVVILSLGRYDIDFIISITLIVQSSLVYGIFYKRINIKILRICRKFKIGN